MRLYTYKKYVSRQFSKNALESFGRTIARGVAAESSADSAICPPSLAEGVRGWVFCDLDSAKFAGESNPPPLSPSAREGESKVESVFSNLFCPPICGFCVLRLNRRIFCVNRRIYRKIKIRFCAKIPRPKRHIKTHKHHATRQNFTQNHRNLLFEIIPFLSCFVAHA
ncbi:hypothetical protein ACWIUD_07185 [Helicobacter sp. 23-1044]